MINIEVKNLAGEKVEDLNLNPDVFGLKVNEQLVHQVYVCHMANSREVLAHTKNRGERAGSGIKPWKQKGTGRARVGQVRSPIWRKGGVVFGPTNDRNYSKKINFKMNQLAIKMTLSGKIADKEMVVVDTLAVSGNKTKSMAQALEKLKGDKGSTLIVFEKGEKDNARSSKNLVKVTNAQVEKLNIVEMLNHKYLVLSKQSVKYLEDKYSKK